MLTLIPEKVDFFISTTDIKLVYYERSPLTVEVDIVDRANYLTRDIYRSIIIEFTKVAEVRCISLNFYETFDENEFQVKTFNGISTEDFWDKYGYHPDPNFYRVSSSEWVKEKVQIYDPRSTLELQHFLVLGYDSYIEVMASKYEIREKVEL